MLTVAAVGLIGTGTSAADPAPSPAGTGKAAAPATDLTQHPKLSLPAPDPAKWGTPQRGADVMASSVRADGSRVITFYTPVPGESASTLYQLLKKQGVTGLQDPAAPATSGSTASGSTASGSTTPALAAAGITSCRYGTAQLYNCATDSNVAHQFHWTNGCCTDPQIWFVDHTGSSWPVNASTSVWNQTPGIDSHYVYGSCPNYSGQHCVGVTSANYGCSGWEGRTTLQPSSTNYYNIAGASIELNDYNGTCATSAGTVNYAKNSSGYRQATCHEQGHALGMGHNSATDSCLYAATMMASSYEQPDTDDFTLLSQLYSVAY
ncbi:matrixin family metalloprotease [Jatrophihabitans sp.]|uniref:matrixin family metalloprotease n=1 Tax=Jatrophihabitans sp. TaxID=1932789 RepID=UPI002D198789|nr:matrixin family metalloprotease [Jatrophihabitans sp.]